MFYFDSINKTKCVLRIEALFELYCVYVFIHLLTELYLMKGLYIKWHRI